MLETQKADKDVDVEAIIEQFGEECKDALRNAVGEQESREGRLRLSAIGKPARKLWQSFYGIRGEALDGPTYIKFLFGHIIEAMVLGLAKLSGHEVTEQQREVELEGVKGHIDCRLDGMLIDVKSASSYGFRKFKENRLHRDDSFGYIPQIKCYAHAMGDTEYGWLAMDKVTGQLAFLRYDESNTKAPYYDAINWDAAEKVRSVKKILEGPLPSKCYEDVPAGKSGNRKLQSGCAWCEFKSVCWPELRTFTYSNGPQFLTVVNRDPRVSEIDPPEGF
jgi:hypothetical protein